MIRNQFRYTLLSVVLGMATMQCTQAYAQPDGDHSHVQYLTVAEINEAHTLFMSKLDAMQAQLDAHLEDHPETPVDPTDPVDPVDPIPPDPPPAGDCTKHVLPGGSIQSAVNASGPGDVICIADGVYREFSISRSGSEGSPIVIRGESRDGVIIDGSSSRDAGVRIDHPTAGVKVGWIVLDNLTVRNARQHGIDLYSTHDIVIDSVVVKDSQVYGLFLAGSEGTVRWTVKDSFFYRNGRSGRGAGIRAGGRTKFWVADGLIENCVFHSNATSGGDAETGTGLNINSPESFLPERKTRNIVVDRCLAYNNGSSGITSQLPADLLWEDCISFDNNKIGTSGGEGYGFRLGFSGAGCRMVRCVAFGNLAAGILLEHQADAVVSGCISYNNPHGVYIKGGNAAMTDTTAYSNVRNFRMDGIVSESGNSTIPMALPTTIVLPSGDLTTWAEVAAQLPGVFD